MSAFKFNCPHCDQHLEAPPELMGETIDCPSCNGSIQLPQPQHERPADQNAAHGRAAIKHSKNQQRPPQTQKPNQRVLLASLAAGLLLVVGLGAGIIVFRGQTQERRGGSAEASATDNPDASTAQPERPGADHSTKILEVLSTFNDKTVVPNVLARYAQSMHRNYKSLIEFAGYDSDYRKIILNKFYLLTVASKDGSLSSASVAAEYEWQVTASPQLKDVVKVGDSDLYTKEAIYTCMTRKYSRLFDKSFSRDDTVFRALAKECTSGAYYLAISISTTDLGLLMKKQSTLSDTITKALDLDFLTTVSQPIMRHFSERHEDASDQYGTLKATTPIEIRLRYNKQDREWVLYE